MSQSKSLHGPRRHLWSRISTKHPVRAAKPVIDFLEDRQLLSLPAISVINQYGIPSVFAIDNAGNVSYNFLTESSTGEPVWRGWALIPNGVGATAMSTGTVLVNAIERPNIFMLNSSGDVLYNYQNSSGDWSGWTQVGANIGATAISSGIIPILNQPFVLAIDSAKNIEFDSMNANGSWAQWSLVAPDAGATAISGGVLQVSLAPTIFEPYVFALNSVGGVEYTARNSSGSWSALSSVGSSPAATSISAFTRGNVPYVFVTDTSGSIYSNNLVTTDPATTLAAPTSKAKATTLNSSAGKVEARSKRPKVALHRVPALRAVHQSKKHASTPAAATTPVVSWAGWSLVGAGSGATPAVEAPAIVAVFTNYAFSLNSSGALYSTFGTAGLWSTWSSLGALATGVTATSVAVTSAPNDSPYAFAIGTDGNVYWVFQSAWATWSTWASIGTPS